MYKQNESDIMNSKRKSPFNCFRKDHLFWNRSTRPFISKKDENTEKNCVSL